MATDPKLRDAVVKLGRTLALAAEQHEAVMALLEAEGLDLVALGKRALETFGRLWKDKYGEPYVFDWAKDRAQAKRLLSKGMTIERLEDKMASYILLRDPFIVQARHPFGLFLKRINSLGDTAAAAAPARAFGCRHVPPCRSDVEHTTRSQRELRQ